MKRIVYILILLACAIVAKAQKLTVESFVLASNDITASSQLRTDNNGDPCALIKVRLAASGASFDGNIVGNTAY
ncbi:MAG: hypothetical protein KBT29_12405, partial [Prevotellaceae bacterium]|nr:hypothetical protein [Candidatus Minthosoma caballi]